MRGSWTDLQTDPRKGREAPGTLLSPLLSCSLLPPSLGLPRNPVFSLGFLQLFMCSHTCVVCMGHVCVVYVVQHVICCMV